MHKLVAAVRTFSLLRIFALLRSASIAIWNAKLRTRHLLATVCAICLLYNIYIDRMLIGEIIVTAWKEAWLLKTSTLTVGGALAALVSLLIKHMREGHEQ